MDIEAPHGPIESWKDFFIHLCIITLGLLIALGLEGMVAHFHERNLVKEARANIRTEIVENQKSLEDFVKANAQNEAEIQHLLDYLDQLKKNPKAHGSATIAYSMIDLNRSSWNTAAATGALSFMKYRDVKHYEDIYDTQKDFALMQQQALDSLGNGYASFFQMLRQQNQSSEAHGDATKLTEAEVTQINAVQEKLQLYLARLTFIGDASKSLDQQYSKFLKSN